jgi:hypothetical protein
MRYRIVKTNKKGMSLFSEINLESGSLIGEYISRTPNNIGKNIMDSGLWESEICRYVNHSFNPNSEIFFEGDVWNLYSKSNISIGDEIVVDYVVVALKLELPENIFYNKNFIEFNLTNFGEILPTKLI